MHQAQPNHAADLKSPPASHLLTFHCKASDGAKAVGQGKAFFPQGRGREEARKAGEGREYSSGNTPVCHKVFVVAAKEGISPWIRISVFEKMSIGLSF